MEHEMQELIRRCDRFEWRIDALDRWRSEVDKRLAVMESEVITIEETRKLQEALRNRDAIRLSGAQKVGGFLVGIVAVADLVKGLVT